MLHIKFKNGYTVARYTFAKHYKMLKIYGNGQKQMVFFICIKKCVCLIVSICKDVFFKSYTSWINGKNGKLSAHVHTNVYLNIAL